MNRHRGDIFGKFHDGSSGGATSFRQNPAVDYPLLKKLGLSEDHSSVSVNQMRLKNLLADAKSEANDAITAAYLRESLDLSNKKLQQQQIATIDKLRRELEDFVLRQINFLRTEVQTYISSESTKSRSTE